MCETLENCEYVRIYLHKGIFCFTYIGLWDNIKIHLI